MNAIKYTLTVKSEALSKDCFPGLLTKIMKEITRESNKGSIQMDDGDTMEWDIKQVPVKFQEQIAMLVEQK